MKSILDALRAIESGRYIVAVSGGVDSMVLLDALRKLPGLDIVVAHANHGMRLDADEDMKLVRKFCMSHNITFETQELYLEPGVSEEKARNARYEFLQNCRKQERAKAIITAHQQDEVIETAIINLLRGTGWRGLAPFTDREDVLRPLLNIPKSMLVQYAKTHNVPWREDSTNTNQRYLRNYARHTLIPILKQNTKWEENFLRLVRNQQTLRRTIEAEQRTYATSIFSKTSQGVYSRRYIWCMLTDDVAYELFQLLCRQTLGHTVVRSLAESALLFIRVAKQHKTMPLNAYWRLRVTVRDLIVEPHKSMVK